MLPLEYFREARAFVTQDAGNAHRGHKKLTPPRNRRIQTLNIL